MGRISRVARSNRAQKGEVSPSCVTLLTVFSISSTFSRLACSFVSVALAPWLAACSDDQVPVPRVTFASVVQPGLGTSAQCPETGAWFRIGSFGNVAKNEAVRPVEDQATDESGGVVTLSCSVTPSNDGANEGFQVAATANLGGSQGGQFTVQGFFLPNGDQGNVAAIFSATGRGEAYQARGCTARYPSGPLAFVAPGRVWATLECPEANNESQQRVCSASAEFRFENCLQ